MIFGRKVHPSLEWRVFRHFGPDLTRRAVAFCMEYSHLPQAKIWASLGSPAPLPEVAGKLRCLKAPLWTFDYHIEKS